jgi:cell division protein FtsB
VSIRWDRLSRYGLLVVLVGLMFLYVNPARSWLHTRHEAAQRKAAVQRLEHERDVLLARRRALGDPQALETDARRLGMVKPGERAYVVRGLPQGE